MTDPGILQVRRYFNERGNIADMVYDIHTELKSRSQFIDPLDPTRSQVATDELSYRDLFMPVFSKGKRIYSSPSLKNIGKKTFEELEMFHPAMRRFLYPQPYFVGLEKSLYEIKLKLIQELKQKRT